MVRAPLCHGRTPLVLSVTVAAEDLQGALASTGALFALGPVMGTPLHAKISMGLTLDQFARRLRGAECGGPLQSSSRGEWQTCLGSHKGDAADWNL